MSRLRPEGCRAHGWRSESKRSTGDGPAARSAGASLGGPVTGSGSHEARARGRSGRRVAGGKQGRKVRKA